MAYAIIRTGGKQYRVATGDTIEIELLDAEAGQDVALDKVLALSDGNELKIGMPYVEGAKVVVNDIDDKAGQRVGQSPAVRDYDQADHHALRI